MSANTSITEGGKPRPFGPVKVLMVQGSDGKYYPWFPESDRALSTLSVDKNGIYRASDKGVYGWSRVSVNVPQNEGVSGKDPDTGEDVYVHPDPETGELVEDVLPVEIRIITPPTFTGPYGDGAYIDFTGLTVAAYGANGDKMQDVPFNELVFPVTVTDIGQVQPGEGERDVSGTDLTPPVYIKPLAVGMFFNNLVVKEVSGGVYGFCMRGVNYEFAVASYVPGYVTVARDDGSFPETFRANTEFNYGGKTCFIGGAGTMGFEPRSSVAFSAYQSVGAPSAAGIALLGTKQIDGGQPIPVQWPRKGDGAVLETSFYVEVVDVSPSNNDGN